jgi:hypothetical protein
MPIIGHIAQTGQIVATNFRTGNVAPSCWLDIKVLIKVEALSAQLLPRAGKC